MGDEAQTELEKVLESGWQALDRGAAGEAARLAKQAVALDASSAEAQTLTGGVASAEGDLDAALAAFQKAMSLDPEYFEPALLAAQLTAASGDLETGLTLAEQALDRAEEEEEYLDALLFKAELELAIEDGDAAAETLADLPPLDVKLPEADFHIRAAACFFELDDLDSAEAHFRSAAELAPELGDAQHGLALLAQARGDEKEMISRFEKVRALDLAAPSSPFAVPEMRLVERAEAARNELPAELRDLIAKAPIRVEPYPSEEMVKEGLDPRTVGLFTGEPLDPEDKKSQAHLEHILLFQKNLERDARSADELDEELKLTLLHETAHLFGIEGFDEEGFDELDED